MKNLAILNPENGSEEEIKGYPVREAARAVVVDEKGNVALLFVKQKNYYKLPGGGIEDSEDQKAALARECLEEIGCEVEVVGEIGTIVEYRKIYQIKQISYCYFAKLKGEKGNPDFTDDEIENGFEVVWLPYEQAVETLSHNNATNIEGKSYIVPRDTIFLKTANKFLSF